MNLINKLKSFAVLLFVCTFLVSTSLTSCTQKGEATEEAEHPSEEEAEHPAGDSEHPTEESDTTAVEGQP